MKLLFVLVAAAALCGCHKPKASDSAVGRDQVIEVDSNDAEMNAAQARARAELDIFLGKIRGGETQSFSVKVPIKNGKETEYFWLSDVAYKDGSFTGKIDNDPEKVHTVKLGDPITVKREEIADWLYMKNDRMYGNYTMRVLLKKMSPEEAGHWRQILAE